MELRHKKTFSILCDEGNDMMDKNFAILVHLWDENLGKPITCFLTVCSIATGENLFEQIDKSHTEKQIPWSMLLVLNLIQLMLWLDVTILCFLVRSLSNQTYLDKVVHAI